MADIGAYAVGDALAFREHSPMRECVWRVYKIEKITASGRIGCGPYTLNPNLTVRGKDGCGGAHRGQAVTPEIIEEIRRHRAIRFLKSFDWKSLPTDSLVEAIAVARRVECAAIEPERFAAAEARLPTDEELLSTCATDANDQE